MDVRIINNCEDSECRGLYGELVLQSIDDVNKIGEFVGKKYYIFNIGLNERYEILPTIIKYDFIQIIDCDFESKYLYFISCKEVKHQEKVSINLIRYSIVTGESKIMYSFEDDKSIIKNEKRMKIFVMDENHILVQNEYLKEDEFGNVLGFLDIDLVLIDVSDGKIRNIYDETLVASGIDTMIPIKRNVCIMKTGYSMIVDNRFDLIKENERPLERLAIINTNQFISDMLLNKKEVYCEPIDTIEKNGTYPYIKKFNELIVYSKVNMVSHLETVVVYNINDKNVKTYLNKDVFRSMDLLNPCILSDQKIYFIRYKDSQYFFMCGETGKTIYQLENCKLKQILNGLVIVERIQPKNLFRRAHSIIDIYRDLASEPVIKEEGSFVAAVSTNPDNMFVFTKNGRI